MKLKYVFDREILNQEDIKDLPIVLVSVAGDLFHLLYCRVQQFC